MKVIQALMVTVALAPGGGCELKGRGTTVLNATVDVAMDSAVGLVSVRP